MNGTAEIPKRSSFLRSSLVGSGAFLTRFDNLIGLTEFSGNKKIAHLVIAGSLFLATCAGPIRAQHEGHGGEDSVGWVPQEILQRPVQLRRNIGNVHEKVTTTSADAQTFYDQGLNYLSSYVWIEAARSFHQALRLDPSLAAAYLGLSQVCVALQDIP